MVGPFVFFTATYSETKQREYAAVLCIAFALEKPPTG
jgi:hypothetical protein